MWKKKEMQTPKEDILKGVNSLSTEDQERAY